MAFSFYSPVTVQSGQVPSTQTNFPMLVSYTDNRLKSVANGGHCQTPFDIRPYSDSSLTTALTFELVFYSASTGQVEMWVKIPSLSDGYVIYLAYGDASLSSDGSSTSTWDSNFVAVYHLGNGTTLNLNDSTSNARTLTNTGSHVSAGSGQIDGGASFNGTNGDLVTDNFTMGTVLTISCWVKHDNTSGMMYVEKETVNNTWALFTETNLSLRGGGTVTNTTTRPSDNTWTFVAGSITGTSAKLYLNGAAPVSGTVDPINNNNSAIHLGNFDNSGYFLNGSLDEVHISDSIRSDNWLKTEYNNQSVPSTFAVLGTEVMIGGSPQAAVRQLFVFP